MEAIINDQIAAGNYVIVVVKPTIGSASFRAVSNVDFLRLRLMHDSSLPH